MGPGLQFYVVLWRILVWRILVGLCLGCSTASKGGVGPSVSRDPVGTGSRTIHMDRFLLLLIGTRGFLQRIFVLLFSCLKQSADLHFIYKT